MKQIVFSIIIIAWFSSLQGQTITEKTALKVAANYFQYKTGKNAPRMTTLQPIALRGSTSAYYLCTPEDKKGFVIVAGNKGSIPILAYSPDGNFPADNIPPVVQYWLNGYQIQIEEIVAKRLQPTPAINEAWTKLETGAKDSPEDNSTVALMQTTWNQSPYYNSYCPATAGMQAPTGCVATAMAQIMKYWNFPVAGSKYITDVDNNNSDGISGTFSAWVGGDYYDWHNMPNALSSNTPQNQKDEVAWLIYNCGIATKMNYGTAESGAWMNDARDAFTNTFGYQSCSLKSRSDFSTNDWLALIQTELGMGRPVLYSGTDYTHSPVGAHAWVCDGYDGTNYSMNWGWGGSCNGLYSLGNLNPENSGYVFNSDQKAIIGIQPPGCTAHYEGALPILPGGIPAPLETNGYIHITSGTVMSGYVSFLNAGTEIVLEPGFSIQAGATANIFIEGCNGLIGESSDDRSETETPSNSTVVDGVTISPNPFTTNTTVTYTLPEAEEVTIQIFNAVGNLVVQPIRQTIQDAGVHEYNFEASSLPTGVYFLILQTGNQKMTKRLILTR